MVCNDKPTLDVSSTGNAKRLTTASYDKWIPKVMRAFAINSIQPITPTADEHFSNDTVSIDRAKIALCNEPFNNANQSFSVKKEPPRNHDANGQGTVKAPDQCAVDQIVSHGDLQADFCHRVC